MDVDDAADLVEAGAGVELLLGAFTVLSLSEESSTLPEDAFFPELWCEVDPWVAS